MYVLTNWFSRSTIMISTSWCYFFTRIESIHVLELSYHFSSPSFATRSLTWSKIHWILFPFTLVTDCDERMLRTCVVIASFPFFSWQYYYNSFFVLNLLHFRRQKWQWIGDELRFGFYFHQRSVGCTTLHLWAKYCESGFAWLRKGAMVFQSRMGISVFAADENIWSNIRSIATWSTNASKTDDTSAGPAFDDLPGWTWWGHTRNGQATTSPPTFAKDIALPKSRDSHEIFHFFHLISLTSFYKFITHFIFFQVEWFFLVNDLFSQDCFIFIIAKLCIGRLA